MANHQTVGTRDTAVGDNPFHLDVADAAGERSNIIAFLLGGVVITGGLLAFLYLDGQPAAARGLAQSDGFLRIETSEGVTKDPARRVLPGNPVLTN